MKKAKLSIFIDENSFNEIQSQNKSYQYVMANKYWRKRIEGKKYTTLVLKSSNSKSLKMLYLGFEKQIIPRKRLDKKPIKIFAIRISISKKFWDWDENLSECERANEHFECYGVLWTCTKCKIKICCAEGSSTGETHLDNLCDDCWKKYNDLFIK